MQKSTKKASILIWSIFLSLIISFSFIYISTKVAKNIKENSILGDFFSKNKILKNFIFQNFSGSINDNEYLIEIDKNYNIKKDEDKQFIFSGNTNFLGKLFLIDGGPIFYEIKSFSGLNTNIEYPNILTGILLQNSQKIFTGYLGNDYDNASIYIKNIGGLSNIYLDFDGYNGTGKVYKVVKNIGGNIVEEKIIEN